MMNNNNINELQTRRRRGQRQGKLRKRREKTMVCLS